MSEPVTIAVVGAGTMGRRHIEAIAAAPAARRLHSIVDPDPQAKDRAAALGVAWHPHIGSMLAGPSPDGVIVATPNPLHVPDGLACVEAGLPVLVEKPIAADVSSALRLVEAAEQAGVPLLVGHHRRHNPLITAAKQLLDAGRIGRIVAVNAMFWLCKPDDYFLPEWRKLPGTGPLFVNLIHDIDLLRYLCGEIASVQAVESRGARNGANEDTAAIILRFASGALGTASMSDAVAAPWSWELTACENPAYPPTGQSCYQIGGTDGSLELPALRLWSYPGGGKGWFEKLACVELGVEPADPLLRQMAQFCAVIRGTEPPLVSGREGLRTLSVIEAIKRSAQTGAPVEPGDL